MISLSWKHGKPSEGAKKRFGNAVNGAYPSPAVRVPKMGEHMTVRKSKSACVQRTAAITLPESLVLTFIIGVLAGHAGPKHFSRFGKSELKAAHVHQVGAQGGARSFRRAKKCPRSIQVRQRQRSQYETRLGRSHRASSRCAEVGRLLPENIAPRDSWGNTDVYQSVAFRTSTVISVRSRRASTAGPAAIEQRPTSQIGRCNWPRHAKRRRLFTRWRYRAR